MKRLIYSICIGLVLCFNTAFGQDMRFTSDQIANMPSSTRNALFEEIKKQAEAEKLKKEQEEAAKIKVDESAIAKLSEMDIASFQAKLTIVADAVNVFCQKLGVTVNDFIKTPVGTFTALGIVYKMGVFASMWDIFKGTTIIMFFFFVMFLFNSKKKIPIEKRVDGNVVEVKEEIVPRFTPVISGDTDDQTTIAIIANVICIVIIIITFWNM